MDRMRISDKCLLQTKSILPRIFLWYKHVNNHYVERVIMTVNSSSHQWWLYLKVWYLSLFQRYNICLGSVWVSWYQNCDWMICRHKLYHFTVANLILLRSVNEYKRRLLLRCIHHFKSDLIYNMDHMRISGTEPSSVILSQTNYLKL